MDDEHAEQRALEEAEWRALRRWLGTPDQVREKVKALDGLIEESKRRAWLINSIRQIAITATIVTAGWLAFKGAIVDFIAGLKP